MTLSRKITVSFFLSAFIIGSLAAFEYLSFIQIRNEMRYLEITDTIRSESLQLRRHEKNFFLFPDREQEERAAMHYYITQLQSIAASLSPSAASTILTQVNTYEQRFTEIESLLRQINNEFDLTGDVFAEHREFLPLIQAGVRDRPQFIARFLLENFALKQDHPLVIQLMTVQAEIDSLRTIGEGLIETSKNLDRQARTEADRGIATAQTAILIVFPVFLIVGLGTLYRISGDVVRRIRTLTSAVESVGRRYASAEDASAEDSSQRDEVNVLIDKFNTMDAQLSHWEMEIDRKNQEIIHSKRLALIGTMASGVAHELNNPLNNISLSAQVLRKSLPPDAPPLMQEIVSDIVGQTTRVKGIVGDMLEFAREREPNLRSVRVNALIRSAYAMVRDTMDASGVTFTLASPEEELRFTVDDGQMERVFVNLFSNAVAAMDGRGELTVQVRSLEGLLEIIVSDTGKGMSEDDRDKVFDPFFTKKDKGTGLGLAIVLSIIRKHGGFISVVSEENEGTAFEITLPWREESGEEEPVKEPA